jgi:hypothetical protein
MWNMYMLRTLPLTMKYPPSSSLSSFAWINWCGDMFSRWQRLLRSMMGTLPETSQYRSPLNSYIEVLTQIHKSLCPICVVDPPLQPCRHLAAVCRMTLTRLGGVYVPVLERKLVRGWQYALVDEDTLYT